MGEWSRDTVGKVLTDNGYPFEERVIQNAIQFRTKAGPVVNLYETTGNVSVQGPKGEKTTQLRELFAVSQAPEIEKTLAEAGPSNKVFIVYGHDVEAREQLELILRRLKLEPIVLQNLPSAGDTIIEKLEKNLEVSYACVLLTPDDEGHQAGCPNENKFRARQNVVLELGMFLAKLGRKRVAILHKGDIELPSDIQGLIYIAFQDRVDEAKDKLAAELQEAGFSINIKDVLS